MTSLFNNKEIKTYFEQNNYFGLGKDTVVFFP